ncbi:hypothetical protein MTR67_003077 [Solanum verrucosum]|uniref:SNF2 N-terminal domain-containing protein n=1 Tax=Solanum verrucosum TaxID=315347 RepID=A0AAF0PS68_SOLVR|nr:hypothetical protein MTR67_003077 [Solanum verrucosum]
MSVLRIRYVFFRILTGEDGDGYAKETREILLKFPSLLVLDEGHTARNQHRFVWNTLQKIETEKHRLLSGSPFQDNIKELYNPFCVVSQKFAADLKQKRALLAVPMKRMPKHWKSLGILYHLFSINVVKM